MYTFNPQTVDAASQAALVIIIIIRFEAAFSLAENLLFSSVFFLCCRSVYSPNRWSDRLQILHADSDQM